MGRAYSERFALASGPGYSAPYVVPSGYRIVLKCVMARNDDSVAAQSLMEVAGVNFWNGSVPGGGTLVSPLFMLVVYTGEQVRVWGQTQYIKTTVSGYRLLN